jgi:hypothetical protein
MYYRRMESRPELSQNGDIDRQVGLFDEGVGPDSLHQIILFEDTATVLQEDDQRVECLWCQRHGLFAFAKDPLLQVQPETSELVESMGLGGHNGKCDIRNAKLEMRKTHRRGRL